jgi:hypothetical protein
MAENTADSFVVASASRTGCEFLVSKVIALLAGGSLCNGPNVSRVSPELKEHLLDKRVLVVI